MKFLTFAAFCAIAYKVVFFVLALFDAAEKCGVFELCK